MESRFEVVLLLSIKERRAPPIGPTLPPMDDRDMFPSDGRVVVEEEFDPAAVAAMVYV